MTDSDIVLKVALSMTRGATCDIARRLPEAGVSLQEFFELSNEELSQAMGFAPGFTLDSYHREEALFAARREVEFMQRHKIQGLFINDEEYPWRVADVADAPILLYKLGNCELNVEHPLSVVGTRRITSYGMDFCKRFVEDVASYFPDLLVVSGLAFGADAMAHTTALHSGVKTVGVLAHGLNSIYPAAHRELAKRILQSGGALLSEYPYAIAPFKKNFLERNRIVAGLSDAVVVVESELRGGAMSTANHAFGYNRDVFALPGRASDQMSTGCNNLIRRHKAHLITCAADVLEQLDWQPLGLSVSPGMRSLFPELQGENKQIYDFLRFEGEACTLDAIHQHTHIPMAKLMGILSDLEFDGVVLKHPGNRYSNA